MTVDLDNRSNVRKYPQLRCVGGLIACVLMLAGCGSDQLETAPVSGKVTLDGKPLTNAQVVFSPPSGRGARGILDPDGTFVLGTYTKDDGAILGAHQVTIQPVISLQPSTAETEPPSPSSIPERYTITSTSGLSFEVKPTEENHANFNLSSH